MINPIRLTRIVALALLCLSFKPFNAAAEPIMPPGLMLDSAMISETVSKICPDIEEFEETKSACFWPAFFCSADTRNKIENALDKHCKLYEFDEYWVYGCNEDQSKNYKADLKKIITQPSTALKVAKDCRLYPDKYVPHQDETPVKPDPSPEASPSPSPTAVVPPGPDATPEAAEATPEAAVGLNPPSSGNPPVAQPNTPVDIPGDSADGSGGCSLSVLESSAKYFPALSALGFFMAAGLLRKRKK